MFIIKGKNLTVAENHEHLGQDFFIKITGDLSHTCVSTVNKEVTRFTTAQEAEETAKKQIIGAFQDFEIIEEK
jgi:hypothetical protein